MDPLGFALENFDAIGRWRESEEGQPIDASGTLPGGVSFRGPSGLRAVLVDRRERFARCLAEKLLTYALGRGVGPADRCSVDEIVRKLDRGDSRSSALITAIVESPPIPESPAFEVRTMKMLSRRTALRGLGTAIALPWLEAMTPRTLGASADRAPTRMAFVYVPNGVHMPDWTPQKTGPGFDLPPLLEPLASVRDDLLVLSGLALDPARAHGDGGGDHARAMATFLTGTHPRKTGGADLRAGISVDQLAARRVGQATRFASLEIGCEGGRDSGQCDHGYSCAYQVNLSWRGESAPATKEVNPRLVFDRLFANRDRGEANSSTARRERRERSLLDFVADDARRLRDRLGVDDRRKLDEYLSGVREIERRIDSALPTIEVGQATMRPPTGIPADYREHLRLMADLLVLAFRADLTRVATFVFANDGSNRGYGAIGVPEGHHDLSHHGQDERKYAKIRAINRFHVEQFAYLINRLKEVREGDATLLDHSMVVYGSGISDGNAHAHENLPILLAGRGNGTLTTGRHIALPNETPLTNLHLSMLDRMGAAADSFGDSTGRLEALTA